MEKEMLKVKIFADGADLGSIKKLYENPAISGFTTNPTLMNKSGVKDYEEFAKEFLDIVPDRPISFEVFADDEEEILKQARILSSWGDNVFVKIPVTTTDGNSTTHLVEQLAKQGIQTNVTAMFTIDQLEKVLPSLIGGPNSYVSIFAGRIADAGVDPLPIMESALDLLKEQENIELIWASPREVFNIVQADKIGCDVITVTPELLARLPLIGKNLEKFSLETVNMFFNDAKASGYSL